MTESHRAGACIAWSRGPHHWGCDRKAGQGRGFDDGPVRGYGVGSPVGPRLRPPPRPAQRGCEQGESVTAAERAVVSIA